ncbi:hypothetical protein OKW50_002830 [Paraburkholderia youngii]
MHTTKRSPSALRPLRRDHRDEFVRCAVLAAVLSVGADEVGVAETADGFRAILFAARPQIAACKTAEHGRPPGIRALALQRVEDFLDRVRHAAFCPVFLNQ